MPTPFMSSTPGRLMLAAAALFMLSAAALMLWGSAWIFGLGMPAAITIAFVGFGLGLEDYTKELLFTLLLGLPALWGFMYLVAELIFHSANAWGWGVGLCGMLALAKASMGGAELEAAKA
ncbi:MAG: hypothetical protein EXR75_16190 [Myxococcales bacterium]|nr:hypothetical protein [Myxococcales bacterium]